MIVLTLLKEDNCLTNGNGIFQKVMEKSHGMSPALSLAPNKFISYSTSISNLNAVI